MADWVLATEQDGYTRHFGVDSLPVTIGGGDDDITLAGVRGSVQIGCLDDVFFVQPRRGTDQIRIDGEPVRGSKRITDGAVIAVDTARLHCSLGSGRLTVAIDARITAGDTAPPDFDEIARADAAEVAIAPVAFRPQSERTRSAVANRLTPAKAAVTTAFVVLAALAWFAFTAKSVGLDVNPAADEIGLPDTLLQFRLGERYLVRPGRHRVTATLDGYYPLDTEIQVGPLADQTFPFELTKLPGLISFATETGVEATVSVDGMPVGTTPLTDAEIVPGRHRFEFVAERHLPEVIELDVEGGHAQQSVVVALTPSWAPVSVTSDPPGATVSVDGVGVGVTPVELELTAGERALELTLAGHNAWRDRIMVVADEPQTLPAVALQPADGRIELASQPSDASISVNGEYRGRTPMSLRLRPGRAHAITVAKPGYETATRELSVDADSGRVLSIDLVEIYGEVDIQSAPEGADIFVNGERVGATPNRLELLAVDHTIEVRADGFAPETREITPRPGYPQTLSFDLTELDLTTGSGFASRVQTSLGQELRLLPAGRFTMGSSRREQGRRSNEMLREVELSSAFYLGVREVTNAEFRAFRPEHDSGAFGGQSLNEDGQPVARITWQDAAAYLNWLSVQDGLQPVYTETTAGLEPVRPLRNGYRLPTEAEWAWAARAAGRDAVQAFGWGSEPRPPSDRTANLADLSAAQILPTTLVTYNDGFAAAAPVGSFAANPVGIFDLDGNAAEWVQDYYEVIALPSSETEVDPLGPEDGRFHVVRGPSWRSASITDLRLAYRFNSADSREDIGFRIARSLPAAP